jgi:tellurite resistance protein TehA-like permease
MSLFKKKEASPDRSGQLPEATTATMPVKTHMGHHASALARRIHGWSWQAFPIGMGTGAVYITLALVKYRTHAVTVIATIFYFLNVALFLLNSTTLFLQAILYPKQAKRLLNNPLVGLFVPSIVLTFATIIVGTVDYAVPLHHVSSNFVYVLFWLYVGFAVLTCFPMLNIWFNEPHELVNFTPVYAFLIFPLMIVGIVATNVLSVMDLNDSKSLGVLLVGLFFQGIGTFMTFFYICIYILRIITTGFLDGDQANGAFIACGPPGFTGFALVSLSGKARTILTAQNVISPIAGEVWYAASILAGMMLFGLAVFFFLFGLIPWWHKLHKHVHGILGCWALTFPNVGWIALLREFGDIFNIKAFYVIHLIFAIILCLTWLVLFTLTCTAFFHEKIFFSKEEDVVQDSPDEARSTV